MTENKQTTCLIMMATYNGEKYIKQQLDSILKQDFQNWHLIVQDDHSKDSTMQILSEYAQKDNRIEVRLSSGAKGAFQNFHLLINYCKHSADYANYDFYMFADQDDVWYENKISKMIDYLNKHSNKDIPSLLYANMALIDGYGEHLEGTTESLMNNGYKNNLIYFFHHAVWGTNTMMNNKLFVSTPDVDAKIFDKMHVAHDTYYVKSAALIGKVFYINCPLMDYRRHGNNVTSTHNYNYGIKGVFDRINGFDFLDKLGKKHACTYNQTLFLINNYREARGGVSLQQEETLNQLESVIRKGGILGVIYFAKNHITWGRKVRTISHYLTMLFGTYKKYLLV